MICRDFAPALSRKFPTLLARVYPPLHDAQLLRGNFGKDIETIFGVLDAKIGAFQSKFGWQGHLGVRIGDELKILTSVLRPMAASTREHNNPLTHA
jgi:hypothetical protein